MNTFIKNHSIQSHLFYELILNLRCKASTFKTFFQPISFPCKSLEQERNFHTKWPKLGTVNRLSLSRTRLSLIITYLIPYSNLISEKADENKNQKLLLPRLATSSDRLPNSLIPWKLSTVEVKVDVEGSE
ncbi:hypothetical protein JTE90_016919 [Oedothorax gibbosus]|uniref:Uncharacterized protein n=1 Tax=Oedothorax gibbosus TaxID=931172 RepID=A0AAV6USQ9_9ARAC|nr:hypothetical protein JTE90_016919 [Oedothorax gibbosus]